MIGTLSKTALSAIFATAIGTMGYFGNFSGIDSTTLEKEYIKKGEASFDDLSASLKKRYYSEREKCRNKKALPSQGKKAAQCEPIQEVKVPQIVKIEEDQELKVPQIVHREEEKIVNTKKERLISQISCSNMGVNEYKIYKECRTKLYEFFKDINPEEYRFEIIPLVDNHDFKILKQIKKSPEICNKLESKIDDTQIKNLFTLANVGLGVYRIKEARWLLRQRFGKELDVKFTPYTINTKYERGFLIRLYN